MTHVIGIERESGIGDCPLVLEESDDSPMLKEVTVFPGSTFFPLGVTRQQLHDLNFKTRKWKVRSGFTLNSTLTGTVVGQALVGMLRHRNLPSGPFELLSYPGLSRYTADAGDISVNGDLVNPDLMSLGVALPTFLNPTSEANPDGSWPLKCSRTISRTYIGETGANIDVDAVAYFDGMIYPFIWFQLEVGGGGGPLVTTTDYWDVDEVTYTRANTGFSLHLFDWGQVPLFLVQQVGTDWTLTSDIFIDVNETFTY